PNANGRVYALATVGSTVAAGGSFSSLGGQRRNNAAALNAADGTLTAWNPDVSDLVRAVAGSGSKVYLGGFFHGADSINGTATRNHAAAVDATTGAVDPNWNPNPNRLVTAFAVSGSKVYLGGYFHGANSINGTTTRNYAAAVDTTTGTVDPSWNPDTNNSLRALVVSGS